MIDVHGFQFVLKAGQSVLGRVAMFATIGYILPEYWRFPGYLSKFLDIKFADVPNGLSAFSKAF